jgi:hypothetical protein
MFRMHLAAALGITATLGLVQGCTNAGAPPPDELTSGDPNPGSGGETDNEPAPSAGGKAEAPAAPPSTDDKTPAVPPAPPAPAPKSKMTFFVTSTGTAALGGNLGGLAGADKKCQDLATAVQGGDHTWHAYLSITGTNAKDRIGTGPWENQKGKVIATTLAALHDFQFIPANADMLDEKGAEVPANRASILTGSKQDGTPLLLTCQGWTSAAGNQQARYGDAASQTSVNLGVRWNDAVKNTGCSQASLNQNKGEGRLYCFAID